MFEILLCSMLTIFPDYLYRRYAQGKRIGQEITLYSVWFELRWGITACVVLTLTLVTMIFYYHPSTQNAVSLFRTVPLVPETIGRVSDVYVDVRDTVRAGDPIFKLDSSKEEAAVETARRKVAEVDAATALARQNLAGADGRIAEAQSAYDQVRDELETKRELFRRNSQTVAEREIQRLEQALAGRQGTLSAAIADKSAIETELSTSLPAQRASAEAEHAEAEVALDKTVVRAGVDGTVEQFTLRVGDLVNPMMRSAGILVPSDAGRRAIIAGFGQIEAQVMRVGMIAEAACTAVPFTVIPLVVTKVQDVVAAGALRPSEQLVETGAIGAPGTLTVYLEPLYAGGLDHLPPGSSCIANAYTSNHDALQSDDLGPLRRFYLHMVDTVGIVHALILRLQALLMPVQTLVLRGH
ncbi:HlyD family secretion protein [Acuticoccus sp. M5D2P5]|uniref:HlyD family secretion protein n=1 Tax=Acuticoccus kalidii TaxID=2910977 RepID=UPI001F426E04|nr:HlyD family secretion protein [Acuticoccus kalidii]MCF3933762.1 HlyD family secretion protein [Acuticoccus kalidii]